MWIFLIPESRMHGKPVIAIGWKLTLSIRGSYVVRESGWSARGPGFDSRPSVMLCYWSITLYLCLRFMHSDWKNEYQLCWGVTCDGPAMGSTDTRWTVGARGGFDFDLTLIIWMLDIWVAKFHSFTATNIPAKSPASRRSVQHLD